MIHRREFKYWQPDSARNSEGTLIAWIATGRASLTPCTRPQLLRPVQVSNRELQSRPGKRRERARRPNQTRTQRPPVGNRFDCGRARVPGSGTAVGDQPWARRRGGGPDRDREDRPGPKWRPSSQSRPGGGGRAAPSAGGHGNRVRHERHLEARPGHCAASDFEAVPSLPSGAESLSRVAERATEATLIRAAVRAAGPAPGFRASRPRRVRLTRGNSFRATSGLGPVGTAAAAAARARPFCRAAAGFLRWPARVAWARWELQSWFALFVYIEDMLKVACPNRPLRPWHSDNIQKSMCGNN